MRPSPAATLAGSADEVEAAFHEAIERGDIDRLMALWADDDEIVCLHPGGGRAVGAAAIRAVFEAAFAAGGVAVRPEQVRRIVHLGSALHHFVVRLAVPTPQGAQPAWLQVSNLYLKTAQGWRLAAHHASPCAPPDPTDAHHRPSGPLH